MRTKALMAAVSAAVMNQVKRLTTAVLFLVETTLWPRRVKFQRKVEDVENPATIQYQAEKAL